MTLSSESIIFNSDSNKNGVSGNCITKIIRRILCISNLPTQPFDHVKEEAKYNSLECGSATPGLVARLMGLDSLPPIEPNQSPSTNLLDLNRKSRSLRRRKIIPTYQELEDENFFILSFDRDGENLEFTAERWKSSSCSAKKQKQRRRRDLSKENLQRISIFQEELDCENKISEIRKKDSGNVLRPLQNSSQNSKGAEGKQRKAKRHSLKVDKLKTERDSENSSPNSVLDFLEFPPDTEAANPGDNSRLGNSKLRRPLSAELGNIIITYSSNDKRSVKDSFVEEEKHTRLRNNSKENFAEKWDEEISKLAARELVESSSWLTLKNYHFEVIGRDLAVEIFDQLLLDELLIRFIS